MRILDHITERGSAPCENIATFHMVFHLQTMPANSPGENHNLVEQIFQNAQFVQSLGIELTSWGKGWCETRIKAAPAHRQQHGFIHAGVLMTIADHTCGGAAASTVPEGRDVITVENKISFLRPASSSELTCRAEALRTGKNLVFVEAEIIAIGDKDRVMVAKASSTLAVIDRKVTRTGWPLRVARPLSAA